jgi:integrase
VSFGEYAEKWYARRCRAVIKPLAPTTAAKYRRLLDFHILPTFKDRKIGQITPNDIQDWWDGIAREHRSTASDGYRLLSTIYNSAIKDRLITSSPCEIQGAAVMPREDRPTVKVEELQRAIDSTPPRFRLAYLLAAGCALRRGEVLGLRRRSVDLADNSISITETWVAVLGGRPVLKDPKSKAGTRKLYMPENVAVAMAEHLERFVGPEPDAWLFGTKTGTVVSPRNLSRAWDKARAKAGRTDLHLHDLRHTALTKAAQAGATGAELRRMGGHSTDAAASRYQQAEDNRLRELASRMGRMAANGTE